MSWRKREAPGPFSEHPSENADQFIQLFSQSSDLKNRPFTFGKTSGVLVYIETLVDASRVEEHILRPLSVHSYKEPSAALTVLEFTEAQDHDKAAQDLLQGKVLVFFEGDRTCRVCGSEKVALRAITEPMNEKVVRGAHDGFVENLSTNIYLLRRRVETKELVIEYTIEGKKTNTKMAIAYQKDIADPELVKEIKRRISCIDLDMAFSPGYMEEMVEDSSLSPFPQLLNTERPDRAVANLLEGRILLFGDGSPTCLILPVTFFSFYQSPDDYNSRSMAGSFYRLLRLFAFMIAVALPALYIAVVSFHLEVVPGGLVLQMKGSIEELPYPPLLEALFMELTIELIREAGIRLPTPIGQTIGIVGGLVIGDAVVSAGLVSNITIIVVALTAVASFVVPSSEMNTSLRLLRFPLMVATSIFGFYGLVFGFMILFIHLCKLESLGKPYFSPAAPLRVSDLKDTLIRRSVWRQNTRPVDVSAQEKTQENDSREWADK